MPNLVARLPMGMFSVSAVIMITAHHGSYALAGAVQATGLIASVVAGPLIARRVDRRGQAAVLVPAVAVCVAGHAALLLCVLLGAPVWSWFCCVLLTGATPNTGGMSRARWAHIFREATPEHAAARHTANAFEQAMDELCFLCGPMLAALLCTALFPAAGTVTASALLLAGALAFAAQRRTEPPPAPPRAGGGPGPLRAPGMPVLLAAFVCAGAIFGALEVVTLAFADERGQQGWAGPVLPAHPAGSAGAGLLFGALRLGGSDRGRFAVCAAAMAALMTLPPLAARADSLPLLAPALLLAGMATAPTMVTGMTLVQRAVPPGRLNEGMTLAVTALLGGIALGAAGGGRGAAPPPPRPAAAAPRPPPPAPPPAPPPPPPPPPARPPPPPASPPPPPRRAPPPPPPRAR
ncbi:MFS transporter, partial [Streptomyces specialis]